MVKRQHIFLALVLVGWFCAQCLFSSGADATNIPEKPDLKPWFQEKGLGTDIESLAEMAVSHPEPGFRSKAIELLKAQFGLQAADILLKVATSDPETIVKMRAGLALARLKDKRAVPPLKSIIDKVNNVLFEIIIASRMVKLGDPSGFIYVSRAKDSPNETERLYSSDYMKDFFSYRGQIIEEMRVDPFEEFLFFAKDPYMPARKNLIYWWPEAGVPEAMDIKYLETLKHLEENDPDSSVQFLAKTRRKHMENKYKP